MARLPTAEELGKPTDIGPRGGIARIRLPSAQGIGTGQGVEAYGRGVQQFGRAIQGLGADIDSISANLYQKQQQDAGIGALKAEAFEKTKKMELERELQNDQDYSTWGDRYEEKAKEIDSEAAAMIPDARLRERWQLEAGVRTASGKDSLLGKAQQRDQVTKKVELVNTLDAHRDIYLDPDSDDLKKAQARADMESAIAVGARTGLITADQEISLRDRYVKGVAKEDANILLLTDPDALKKELDGVTPFQRALEQRESGGNPAIVNKQGYAGSYQFGAPRLVDLGMYRLGEYEHIDKGKWKGDKWTGTFNIPGFPEVKTLDDFLANPDAQKAAFGAHVRQMDREIKKNGLDQYEGSIVGGVSITREGLYAMLHLGGVGSTKKALQSGGEDDPQDDNGTSVLDYAALAMPYSRYASLDPVDRAELQAKTDRALIDDPDVRAARAEIAKTGYDMLLADKMDANWLEAHRDILSVYDYKAMLKGLEPGHQVRKMEPGEYLRLFDLADNDPTTAQDELRDLYARDQIAKDDFKSLFSKAKQNAESTRGRPYSAELRDYVRKQLAPSDRDPKSLQARQLDALFQFDDWLEANPAATREEIRKHAQVIVDDFRQIRYKTGVTELPVPRYAAVPREKIDEAAIEAAKAKTISELQGQKLTAKEAAEQAAILRRWLDLLQYRKAEKK